MAMSWYQKCRAIWDRRPERFRENAIAGAGVFAIGDGNHATVLFDENLAGLHEARSEWAYAVRTMYGIVMAASGRLAATSFGECILNGCLGYPNEASVRFYYTQPIRAAWLTAAWPDYAHITFHDGGSSADYVEVRYSPGHVMWSIAKGAIDAGLADALRAARDKVQAHAALSQKPKMPWLPPGMTTTMMAKARGRRP